MKLLKKAFIQKSNRFSLNTFIDFLRFSQLRRQWDSNSRTDNLKLTLIPHQKCCVGFEPVVFCCSNRKLESINNTDLIGSVR